MKILFVGGSFDDNGGRPSSVVTKFSNEISKNKDIKLSVFNGGYFENIESILKLSIENDVVFWWANVPNDKPKIRDAKSINSKVMLVTSKRNDNEKYNFSELINRALSAKANLCIEFSKHEDKFCMMLFDPLGNCWFKGEDIKDCCDVLLKRLDFLQKITRQGTVNVNNEVGLSNDISKYLQMIQGEEDFFDVIKDYAETFHKLINPAPNVTRFLGNSSFRCQRGFPSLRKDGIVFVSKRNIDKRFIDIKGFVPTKLYEGSVFYWGENKPSVDTPIQLRLYEKLKNIDYMIHAHVYIQNAPFTKNMIPCGGLQEVDEILQIIENEFGSFDKDFYAINLIGHGCIVMSSDVEKLKRINYIGRILPEKLIQ